MSKGQRKEYKIWNQIRKYMFLRKGWSMGAIQDGKHTAQAKQLVKGVI